MCPFDPTIFRGEELFVFRDFKPANYIFTISGGGVSFQIETAHTNAGDDLKLNSRLVNSTEYSIEVVNDDRECKVNRTYNLQTCKHT